MSASEEIKKIRKAANMTQNEFAKEILGDEHQQSVISKFELGNAYPSIKTARRIVEFANQKRSKLN